jgi:hypothetical protein
MATPRLLTPTEKYFVHLAELESYTQARPANQRGGFITQNNIIPLLSQKADEYIKQNPNASTPADLYFKANVKSEALKTAAFAHAKAIIVERQAQLQATQHQDAHASPAKP